MYNDGLREVKGNTESRTDIRARVRRCQKSILVASLLQKEKDPEKLQQLATPYDKYGWA